MTPNTIADLLQGNAFDLPPHPPMYQAAQRVARPKADRVKWTRRRDE